MEQEKHKEKVSKKRDLTEKLRQNPWVLSTFVLGVLILILIIGNFAGGFTGKTISEKDAGEYLISYFENQQVSGLTLESVENEEGFYKVNLNYQDSVIPFYVTKTGYFTGNSIYSIIPSKNSDVQVDSNLPKVDVPRIELFVWSYCPYGVQAQGPMAEVAELLEDYAEFTIIPYYAGHGEHETQQNMIQSCIQKLYPENYWDYAASFVEDIYPVVSQSRDVEENKVESIKLMDSLGIDSDAVFDCVETQGEDLFDEASARAQEAGVTGSPSILINGVKVSVARDAESIKSVVCEAFNDAPEVCDVVLDSSSAAASGNC